MMRIPPPAQRSVRAERKAREQRTAEGTVVHSFATVLQDLATVAKNRVRLGDVEVDIITTPTSLQQRAFELLEVSYRGWPQLYPVDPHALRRFLQ